MALYRVDGLAIFKDISGLRKNFFFCKLFRRHDLELTTQCNRKVVKTHHTVVTESTKMK